MANYNYINLMKLKIYKNCYINNIYTKINKLHQWIPSLNQITTKQFTIIIKIIRMKQFKQNKIQK